MPSLKKNLATALALAALGLPLRASAAPPPVAFPADAWPVYRHDAALTGVSRARGAITRPAVLWEHYLGVPPVELAAVGPPAPADVADLDGDGVSERFSLAGDTIQVASLQGETLWSHRVDGLPLGGNVRVAKLLPDRQGLQIVSFSSRMDTGAGQGYLFAFDKGAARGELVWTTGPLTGQHAPTMVIDDVDGDGLPDVVLAPHFRVQIFNGQNGQLKAEAPWEVGRNYGALVSRPGPDPQHKDLFVICDFVPHVDCIGFRDGAWKHVWGHKYMEPGQPTPRGREYYIRVGPRPVADLDGDARDEVAYLYNDANVDDRWRLHVRRSETGELAADLPGVWLWSILDLDGRGPAELVYTPTDAKRPPTFCDLHVANLVGDRLVDRAVVRGARPLLANAVLPPAAHTIADEGLVELAHVRLADGAPAAIFVARPTVAGGVEDAIEAISFVSLDGDQPLATWKFSRPGHRLNLLQVNAVDAGSGAVASAPPTVVVRDLTAGETLTLDAHGHVVAAESTGRVPGFTTTPIALDLDADGQNEIVLQDAAGEITALRPPRGDDAAPAIVWKAPGAAMSPSGGYVLNGPLCPQAADLDADGVPEIVFAAAGQGGQCEVVCVDGRTGAAKWRTPVDGAPWGGLQAGVDGWTFGRFTGRAAGLDVAVGLHRRSKNSGEGWLLRGDTGQVVWKQPGIVAGDEWASPCNLDSAAVVDADADGDDELVVAASVVFAVLFGETGQPASPPTFMPGPRAFGQWLAYSSPTIADLDGDGALDAYLNSNSYARGGVAACRLDGRPLWVEFHDNDRGADGFGPVGDFDADGRIEIGVPALDGTLTCRHAADNSVKWSIRTPVTGDVIAGDVDGDGVLELVFAGRDGRLRAVSGQDGRELWSIPAAGRPVLADVTGDRLVEVLTVAPDGVLRAIGQAP